MHGLKQVKICICMSIQVYVAGADGVRVGNDANHLSAVVFFQ